MKNNLMSIDLAEHPLRDRLLGILKKKQLQLVKLTSQYELLKLELDAIKREYYVRVGSLIREDNHLDIEIIHYKNILSYIRQGYSQQKALRKVQESDQPDFSQEWQKENFTGKPKSEQIPQDSLQKGNTHLRQLWKKAVMKFHPDLTLDPTEKKFRERVMKKINQAYAEQDFEALQQIYATPSTHIENKLSVEDLEKMLIHTENMIITLKKEYIDLKKTEWYGWKAKMRTARKKGEDVFKDFVAVLSDDVIEKRRILSNLKVEINYQK